mgnify:CR=1 FL=1
MNRIRPYPVALALTFIFSILYLVCVVFHLLVPEGGLTMKQGWEWLLPGFQWLTPGSFVLGWLEIILGSFYTAYVVIPLYNFLIQKTSLQEGGNTMNTFQFKPVALALTGFGLLTYILCIVFDLVFPQWAMYKFWEILLPGFTWISWGSFFIGALGIIVYGLYIAAVFVPIYNYFQKGTYPEMK